MVRKTGGGVRLRFKNRSSRGVGCGTEMQKSRGAPNKEGSPGRKREAGRKGASDGVEVGTRLGQGKEFHWVGGGGMSWSE